MGGPPGATVLRRSSQTEVVSLPADDFFVGEPDLDGAEVVAISMRLHPGELLDQDRSDEAWASLQALIPWPERACRLTRGRFDFLLPCTPSFRADVSLRQLATALLEGDEDADPRIGASFGHASGPAAEAKTLFEAATSALEQLGHHFGVRAFDPEERARYLQDLELRASLMEALDHRLDFGVHPLRDRSGRLVGGVPGFGTLPAALASFRTRALFALAERAGCLDRLWMQATRRAGEALARIDGGGRTRLWVEVPGPALRNPHFEAKLGATREWLEPLDVDLGLRLGELPRDAGLRTRVSSWADDGLYICAPLSEAARGGVDEAPLHALEVEESSQQQLAASSWTASVVFALARAARGRRLGVLAFDVSDRDIEPHLWRLGVDALSSAVATHVSGPAADGS